jgi:hypothetical protein
MIPSYQDIVFAASTYVHETICLQKVSREIALAAEQIYVPVVSFKFN